MSRVSAIQNLYMIQKINFMIVIVPRGRISCLGEMNRESVCRSGGSKDLGFNPGEGRWGNPKKQTSRSKQTSGLPCSHNPSHESKPAGGKIGERGFESVLEFAEVAMGFE